MADEKELELDNKGGKKKKLIIIIAAVVLLGAAGGGAFFFMGGDSEPAAAQNGATTSTGAATSAGSDGGEANESSTAELGTALYVPMPRPFRFNVPGAARDRFVEIRVQLLIRGADKEEEAKKHVPLIESTLLNIFTQSNADDLATSAGKTSLKQKALIEVQKVMTDIAGDKIVEQVLFTGFVMQ